jgi:hypothetical protein
MSALLKKSSYFFFTHFATFSIPPLFMLLSGKNRGVLAIMSLWIPVWLSSSILWSERMESYAFLRLLPATDRRIVRLKFGLALGFAAAYWLLMTLLIRAAFGSTPEFSGYTALADLTCAISLVLAGGWYVFSWRFGPTALTAAVLIFGAAVILSTWIVDVKSIVRSAGIDPVAPRWLAQGPGILHLALLAAALAVYYGLMRLAVRVKEKSEATIL